MLADLVRLLLLILFLPIILIFIGPLLILAVFRGYQPMGPITLDTSRYSSAGRVAALALGIVLWLAVWGGLAWFALYAFFSPTAITSVPTTAPIPVTPQQVTSTATPIPPTSTLVQLVELTALPVTGTPADSLETSTPPTSTLMPTLTPTSTFTPIPAFTPIPTSTPTLVSVETSPTATSIPTPESEVSPTMTPSSPLVTATVGASITATRTAQPTRGTTSERTVTPTISPQATLTLAERAAVVEVVRAGNIVLQEAIAEADEENLQSLEKIWRGLALRVARNFATQMSEQYAKPMVVEFEYLEPPTVDRQSTHSEAIVTSREKWAYGGPTEIDREEVFDFIYTLTREDEGWIISRYTYRNIPAPELTPTPTPSPRPTLTPTPADLAGE